LIKAKKRAARAAEAIAKRVAAFCRGDKQRPAAHVTPLNSGFFQLERMRARQRSRKQRKTDA